MVLRVGNCPVPAAVVQRAALELDLLQQIVAIEDEGEVLEPRDPSVDALDEEARHLHFSNGKLHQTLSRCVKNLSDNVEGSRAAHLLFDFTEKRQVEA